jgi:hypothetical protein
LAFKIIAILHSTRLATFVKLLEAVSKGLFRNRSQNSCHTFLDCHTTLKFLALQGAPHVFQSCWWGRRVTVNNSYRQYARRANPSHRIAQSPINPSTNTYNPIHTHTRTAAYQPMQSNSTHTWPVTTPPRLHTSQGNALRNILRT